MTLPAETLSSYFQGLGKETALNFDLDKTVDDLRYERYVDRSGWRARAQQSWIWGIYYALRPRLPNAIRQQLQRIYLRDWKSIQFPSWPVDRTVDLLFEKTLAGVIESRGVERIPFIWFWPNGHQACAIVTHDVETPVGRDFCAALMDIDDAHGIKASFQIVPEKRYEVFPEYLQLIRDRGFEINVQGLDHDGNLFHNRRDFLVKAAKINEYAASYGARGFRSPVLYRNADWFRDLAFSYDMSTPCVARLEAQRGGCCTVMPYFLPGGMLELPLTLTEDYTLFHMLQEYSTTLWEQQIETILESHGLMTALAHPDYLIDSKPQSTYRALLEMIERLRADHNVWTPLPREVDQWWRQRSAMRLVRTANGWAVEGPESHRASVAFASVRDGRVAYEMAEGADTGFAPEQMTHKAR